MKLQMSIEDALCLKAGLETPAIREAYDKLVDELVKNTACSKEEAQSIIFPDFAPAVVKQVKEVALKMSLEKKPE